MATVNVQNRDDDYCFVWSILAHLHPAQANPHRIQIYTRYASELNLYGCSVFEPIVIFCVLYLYTIF